MGESFSFYEIRSIGGGGGVSWRVSIFPDPLPGHWKEIAMLDYFEILELCSSKHGREHPIWFWPEFNTF